MLNCYKEHEKVECIPANRLDLELLLSLLPLDEDSHEAPMGEEKHHSVGDYINFPQKFKTVDPVPNTDGNLRLAPPADTGVVRLDLYLKVI